jgi:hypothetical protein
MHRLPTHLAIRLADEAPTRMPEYSCDKRPARVYEHLGRGTHAPIVSSSVALLSRARGGVQMHVLSLCFKEGNKKLDR